MKNKSGQKTGQTTGFYENPASMEPMMPADRDGSLADKAVSLLREVERLNAVLSPEARGAIAVHLRWVNSYYSNLIEGSDTHPTSIEAAMRAIYAEDSVQRDRQLEAKTHVEAERELRGRIERSLRAGDSLAWLTETDHVRWLHHRFYRHLPSSMRRVTSLDGERTIEVEPGTFRDGPVVVGGHVPPAPGSIPRFLAHFHEAYRPDRLDQIHRVLAAAASHHRLAWIHPFYDGNGRVARLFTQAYLVAAGLDAQGLWSICRGFARSQGEYRRHLQLADQERRHDADGRGRMSLEQLERWCGFFLDICLDQVRYMGGMLQLKTFTERQLRYVLDLVEEGVLAPGSDRVVERATIHGHVSREEALQMMPGKERTARRHLSTIVDHGLLRPTRLSHRAGLRMHLATRHCPFLLPNLYPPVPVGVEPDGARRKQRDDFVTQLRLLTQEELAAVVGEIVADHIGEIIADPRVAVALAKADAGKDEIELGEIDLFDDGCCRVDVSVSRRGSGGDLRAECRMIIRGKDDVGIEEVRRRPLDPPGGTPD